MSFTTDQIEPLAEKCKARRSHPGDMLPVYSIEGQIFAVYLGEGLWQLSLAGERVVMEKLQFTPRWLAEDKPHVAIFSPHIYVEPTVFLPDMSQAIESACIAYLGGE